MIHTVEHDADVDRLRKVVKFVAVGAGKVAAANGNQVRQHRMVPVQQPLRDHSQFAQPAGNSQPAAVQSYFAGPCGTKNERLRRHTAKSTFD